LSERSAARRPQAFPSAVLATLLLALVAASDARGPRSAGGVRLVEALETGPAAVVGVVAAPHAIDAHGHSAMLQVESSLAGPLPAGSSVQIAWEELAASRAPRFAEGERVLVALEPLPGASLWAKRFPDPKQRSRVFGVAMRGEAFLRAPASGSVDLLQHYLKLAPRDREAAGGVALLARMAARGEPPLALGAVQRLARQTELAEQLDADAASVLVEALLRTEGGPELTSQLLDLVARQRPPGLRAPLEALAVRDGLAPPVVFAALAALDAEVDPDRTERLLAASAPAYREVAARNASGPDAPELLAQLSRSDPAAEVRAVAIERLVALGGASALDPALATLHDPEPSVRGSAARALGTLGTSAVPGLRSVVDGSDPDAARAALVALHLTGAPEAKLALEEIAESHRDRGIRALAEIALGRQVGHTH
jgi:hypothetical protein